MSRIPAGGIAFSAVHVLYAQGVRDNAWAIVGHAGQGRSRMVHEGWRLRPLPRFGAILPLAGRQIGIELHLAPVMLATPAAKRRSPRQKLG